MAYPIDRKLVIGVASSALFDLSESNEVYQTSGVDAYRNYQMKNIDIPFEKGVAFPFIKRFLNINSVFHNEMPVEVVLLSKNSPETGMRVFRSITHYGLNISRAAFMAGKSPHEYIPAFNISLFLSANESDVLEAIKLGYPAGVVLPSIVVDDDLDEQLRVAFDFDGVIADDEAESVYKKNNNLSEFQQHEALKKSIPHNPGPLADLFKKLSFMQKLEDKLALNDQNYQKILRIAIITARNAPAHERVVTTLSEWGVTPDESFFLGGMKKSRILEILKPHLFFDDQKGHLETDSGNISLVHIPFGISNTVK